MDSKKKKTEEVMEVWTNLRGKIYQLQQQHTWTTDTGKVTVYRSPVPPKRVIYARDNELVEKEISLLKKKLEQVRNLVEDNELEKLKNLLKKGEI